MPAARERLFLALWPDRDVRVALARLRDERLPRRGARAIPTGNLHLTLAFLGSVDAGPRARLERACAEVASRAFTLELGHLALWVRSGVACSVPARAPVALLALADALRGVAEACGIAVEERPFRAHVTLARKVGAGVAEAGPHPPIRWPVSGFSLVRSHTGAAGARYEPLRAWPAVDIPAGSRGSVRGAGDGADVG